MADPTAHGEAQDAAWAALAPSATAATYNVATLLLHIGSPVTYRCDLKDHLALARREAERTYEAQAGRIVAAIEALLAGLDLSPEDRDRGRQIAAGELRREAGVTTS